MTLFSQSELDSIRHERSAEKTKAERRQTALDLEKSSIESQLWLAADLFAEGLREFWSLAKANLKQPERIPLQKKHFWSPSLSEPLFRIGDLPGVGEDFCKILLVNADGSTFVAFGRTWYLNRPLNKQERKLELEPFDPKPEIEHFLEHCIERSARGWSYPQHEERYMGSYNTALARIAFECSSVEVHDGSWYNHDLFVIERFLDKREMRERTKEVLSGLAANLQGEYIW